MLKVLLKKQLMEVFRAYFYDFKKNRKRSKKEVILFFCLFALLMLVIFGGMFGFMAFGLAGPLVEKDVGWLYFLIFSMIAILLGAFGSIFNTFAGLYLSKDNDLLLSMPIPVKYIIVSRLLNVYLLGLMYSGLVILPATVIYWFVAGFTIGRFICGLLLVFIISLIVLILSCALGWVVARISIRFKTKSFVIVLLSLVGIALYYVAFTFGSQFVQTLVEDALQYGNIVKQYLYPLYMFGKMGEGDWLFTAVFLVINLAISGLVWAILSFNFIKIATANYGEKKIAYKERLYKRRSVFHAVLFKEFRRLFSSALYMLNCGLGTIFITGMGIAALIFGPELLELMQNEMSAGFDGLFIIIVCAIMFSFSAMNDTAAPSVSLEGRHIWVYQSLPVKPKYVLHAKAWVQIILTLPPILFTSISLVALIEGSILDKVLVCVLSMIYVIFFAYASVFLSLSFVNLTWTNEMTPIKQSAPVMIAILGGWALSALFVGLYILLNYLFGFPVALLLGIFILVFIGITALIVRYFNGKGGQKFAHL